MADELVKRNFHRLDFPLDVTVEIVPAHAAPQHPLILSMKTRNISKGGICLETSAIEVEGIHLLSGSPFARENRLALTATLFPDGPPFEALGEVRWYDIARDIPGCLYRVGVAFTAVSGAGKSQLARFLKDNKGGKGFFDQWLSL